MLSSKTKREIQRVLKHIHSKSEQELSVLELGLLRKSMSRKIMYSDVEPFLRLKDSSNARGSVIEVEIDDIDTTSSIKEFQDTTSIREHAHYLVIELDEDWNVSAHYLLDGENNNRKLEF